MTGELIISFRAEVQQKILSNQDRYNPDKNEFIDASEIGVLLADYGATNVKDLQTPKSALGKLNEFVFPKVDVMPAEGNGYRVKYTDGEERFISDVEAAKIKEQGLDSGGAEVGNAILSIGTTAAAGTTIGYTYAKFVNKVPGAGKIALITAAIGLITGILAKKCANSVKNDETIEAKLRMHEQNEKLQAEIKKREEERRQADLEYKERIHAATSGIESNLSGIESNLNASASKTRVLNSKLHKANESADSVLVKLNQ